uniref:Large ribosomal subunit protein uL10m n=1 Tax=Strix occidentalis caurina TaxID=311401 RepID=A0A8D0F676_STROC
MALFPLCALSAAWLPALQLVRRGSKAVTRHWKAMHFQRQKLMAVTEYLAPRPAIPPGCLPPKKETLEEDNGYVRLLRRQVEEVLRDNRMIAVCHYNSMPGEDMVLMRHYLRKHNIEVKFGQTVGALALLPSQTSSLLQRGSAHLTALLDQHIHQLRAGEPGGPTEPSPTQSVGAQ